MWIPHAGSQEEFCRRAEFEALYGGAAGPGKTDCLVALATEYVHVPGYRGILFRRTFPQLQEIQDRCWALYPQIGGQYRATERRWYFPGGDASGDAKPFVQTGHMQHEDDKHNYQGKQFNFAGFDELTQFTETQYLYITASRVRSAISGIPSQVRSSTNPGNIGHLWVKGRFVDIGKAGSVHTDPLTGLQRVFIPGTVYDNPTLMENDPGYVQRLEMLPEIEKKRLLYGDWEVFEGQVFAELSYSVHGCDPFDIPPEWERFMVVDWGFSKPFCVLWFAIDHDGVMYVYREWYGCKEGYVDVGLRMIAGDVAQGILDREEPGERVRVRLGDASMQNKQPQNRRNELVGPDLRSDFVGQGVPLLMADPDRIQGIGQVHKRFALETEIDQETGEVVNEYPKVQIFRTCEHFWRTVPALQADPNRIEDVEHKVQEDHVYDAFRYGCMFRPIRPKRPVTGPPRGSFQSERAKLLRARKYARSHGVSLDVAYTKVR